MKMMQLLFQGLQNHNCPTACWPKHARARQLSKHQWVGADSPCGQA